MYREFAKQFYEAGAPEDDIMDCWELNKEKMRPLWSSLIGIIVLF